MSLTNDSTEQIANDLGLQIRSNAENHKVAKQIGRILISMIIDPIHKLHREFQMGSGDHGYTNSLPSKHKPRWPRGHSLVAVNNSKNGQWMGEKE